jgi:hypothetical protein
MRPFRNAVPLAPAFAVLACALMLNTAEGLPLFARKYTTPCTTCHVVFPRLNAFGMQFKQNGYRMPGTRGESPWDSTGFFPLSLVGNVGYTYTSNDSATTTPGKRQKSSTSAFIQNASEFHSAGTLAPLVTFHFDNNFEGAGG